MGDNDTATISTPSIGQCSLTRNVATGANQNIASLFGLHNHMCFI